MQITASIVALAGLISSVAAHGVIHSPAPRTPGSAYQAACGNTIFKNENASQAGPIELLLQSASSITDPKACNLWLCKGYQFDDNTAKVQTYSPGQTIPFKVDILVLHTGYANVSIVNTKSNTIVGSALKSWGVYASTSTGVKAEDTSFSVTIPESIDGCAKAGECVLQWFWYALPAVDQTYEGCVDFVISGSGSPAPTTPEIAVPGEPTPTLC